PAGRRFESYPRSQAVACGTALTPVHRRMEGTMVTGAEIERPLARRAMAYVLAGGRGSRLLELTEKRAKPAVHFGGKLRIIDFALSNALNSGIRHIAVATQ